MDYSVQSRQAGTVNEQQKRSRARELLGGVCVICKTAEQLEFDHIDWRTKPKAKKNDANRVLFRQAWAVVEASLPLLQLLCRPCHIEKSRQDRLESTGQRPYWEHGTVTGYYHKGCRCEECRQAMREYVAR